jgi:asparagine synthase (glutamine-hydrolysing)
MCGLAAFIHRSTTQGDDARAAVRRMCERMAVRGPDGEGFWTEPGIVIGHRRLAILDPDPRANQPMHSTCGRFVVVFNGEIYNFKALRRDLETAGATFRTTSDTEVLLALFAAEGEAMLPKLHGMFAFVIWDRVEQRAFAARDPYGIKPLYIGTTQHGVLLASQVKALLASRLVSRAPDPRGQAGFWMLGSVPEPHTWYRDIRAVPAGHFMWVEDGHVTASHCWHDLGATWRSAPPVAVSAPEIAAGVRGALRESVARHLVADVPVGVFLSGGIDSGTLAGLMVEAGARDLQGVTIAYGEFVGSHEDEAPVAALIAAHYGIRHHVRRVTREEFLADLPRILDAMDQPSIDGINTWYASKAVAELGLKVVVSGVGGDELFLGYGSFQQLPRMVAYWSRIARLPGAMPLGMLAAAEQARRTGNERWRYAPQWVRTIAGAWWLRRSVSSPDELSELMGAASAAEGLQEFAAETWVEAMTGPLAGDRTLALAQIESMTYLRNQLLRDSDWASMDHSVELRTPLVDAWLLQQVQPFLRCFSAFPGKRLLASALDKPLPREVIDRRKTGFGIPVNRWLDEYRGTHENTDAISWTRIVAQSYARA